MKQTEFQFQSLMKQIREDKIDVISINVPHLLPGTVFVDLKSGERYVYSLCRIGDETVWMSRPYDEFIKEIQAKIG